MSDADLKIREFLKAVGIQVLGDGSTVTVRRSLGLYEDEEVTFQFKRDASDPLGHWEQVP